MVRCSARAARAGNDAAGHRQGVALGHARLRGCSRASRIEARRFCADACRDRSGWFRARGRRSDPQRDYASVCLGSLHQRRLGCLSRRSWGGRRRRRCRRHRLDRRRPDRRPRTSFRRIWLSDLGRRQRRRHRIAGNQTCAPCSGSRGETSPLLEEVLGGFGHHPCQAVAWSEQATATDYATFAPLVLRHATEGDPIGRRIVEHAADAIGDLSTCSCGRESTGCRWSAGCPEQLRLG